MGELASRDEIVNASHLNVKTLIDQTGVSDDAYNGFSHLTLKLGCHCEDTAEYYIGKFEQLRFHTGQAKHAPFGSARALVTEKISRPGGELPR